MKILNANQPSTLKQRYACHVIQPLLPYLFYPAIPGARNRLRPRRNPKNPAASNHDAPAEHGRHREPASACSALPGRLHDELHESVPGHPRAERQGDGAASGLACAWSAGEEWLFISRDDPEVGFLLY